MAVVSNLLVNGTLVQEVIVGTTVVNKVICNGVVVYEITDLSPMPNDDEIMALIQAGKLFTSFVYQDPETEELGNSFHVFTDMLLRYSDWVDGYGEEIANVIKQFLCLIAQKDGDEAKLNKINSAIVNMVNDGTLEEQIKALGDIILNAISEGVSIENMKDYLYNDQDALMVREKVLQIIADQLGVSVEELKEGNF